MRSRFVHALAAGGAVLALVAGCATTVRQQPTEKDVIRSILESSVQIVVERSGDRFRTGSGVVIEARVAGARTDCLVLTSAHTVAGATELGDIEVYVVFDRHRGAGTKAPGRILARGRSEQVDLALLQAPAPQCLAAPLGQPPALGDRVWIVGFPWGRQVRLVSGVVSEVSLDERGTFPRGATLMVDASVAYGMSGGGVFDAGTGGVVGLIEGYGTARVSFGQKPALQHIDVPVPGETYVTSLETIQGFLAETGQVNLSGLRR